MIKGNTNKASAPPGVPLGVERRQSHLKSGLLAARTVALYLFDSVVAAVHPVKSEKNVLLIRSDGIGDFVLWLAAAEALSHHYRSLGFRVTLLADSQWYKWACDFKLFDSVIELQFRRFSTDLRYRWETLRRIRRLGFSVLVEPEFSRRISLDMLARVSGAPQRIAMRESPPPKGFSWRERMREHWYTRVIDTGQEPLMEIVRNAEFTRHIVGPAYRAQVAHLSRMTTLPSYFANSAELPIGTPYFVIFPGAAWTIRRWPVDYFCQVADQIHRETGWRGVVCGSPGDRPLVESLCKMSTAPLLNLAGATTLAELAGIVSGARLLVSNDTGATHIGAATGTPTACILGGGHYGRFLPYQVELSDDRPLPSVAIHSMPCFHCDFNCIFPVVKDGPVPCVSGVSVADLMMRVRALIGLAISVG